MISRMIAKQPRITLQRNSIARLRGVYTPSDNLAQLFEPIRAAYAFASPIANWFAG